MYLRKLELQGFKSFADKTVLEFMPGITTVIGPNGSGKSNISDAIRWVLGEQSIKSLRGSKSEDIIFAGTQNRKSLGFAEASLVIDNTDAKLPIEYQEVIVTRRIYRSGETGYFINKTPCRLKDILELFMDTGIGKDGYSIIGQGKIDEILSNKSEDRRHIFEEAAGIVKYRVRKVDSERKLEQTKLNLLRINDIIAEIEANIDPLKLQSEKAKKFLDLREELKHIEIGLFLHNIDSYKEKIEQIVKDEEIFKEQMELQQHAQENLKILKEGLKTSIDELSVGIESMQNIGFESSNQIEKLNSDINVAKERITNNTGNDIRFEKEIEELKQKIIQLEEEKKQKLAKKTSLYENKEKFQKELKEKEEKLAKLTKTLSGKELEIEAKKQMVEKNTDIKYEHINSISTLDANFENSDKRKRQIKNEIDSTISELDATRLTKEEIAKVFYQIENKKNKLTNSLNDINEKRNDSTKKIKEYEDDLNKYQYELRMKDSRHKFLVETEKEKEGYVKSVKSLLLDCERIKELGKGLNGVLANILTVPEEYETAIEMCLGHSLQNIVTDSEEDAKRFIEHLRKNNLGRASFLPITSVKGNKLNKINQTGISGVVGIASDLVKYSKKYEGVILNLLGRTVIVEDMECAIKLAKKNGYSFRIVTVQGDVINPSGAISGGSVAKKTLNILGRGREIENLEKQMRKLEKKIEEIRKEKEEYLDSIEDILEEADAFEKELQEIDISYATSKQKLSSIEENVLKLEKRLERLKIENANLDVSKQEILKQKSEITQKIEELNKKNEELNRQIEEFANLNKDNQKIIDDLNFDITNLKISVSSFEESETSIDEMADMIEQDIKNSKLSIENKENHKDTIIQDNKLLEETIQNLELQIETIKKEVLTSGDKVENLKKQRQEQNETLNKTEDEIMKQMETTQKVKEQLLKVEVKRVKIENDLEQVINKMWEEYELTPNNIEEYEKPSNIATTTKKVNSLRNEIKALGSINIDAIEEYKATKERYDFMCEQRLDLENGISKLRKIIQEMTSIMKEQFERQFKVINQNFEEVFKELFGGGKAELILTDEENILECGIDIHVQPPGKKLQNMMLLSGGEKALTAIAILFAILKINPAPFCVLDEIEAALDDVNVYRFADYLKKFAKQTQFLVITHRKGTMEVANTVYGITMEESGISKLLSMKLK